MNSATSAIASVEGAKRAVWLDAGRLLAGLALLAVGAGWFGAYGSSAALAGIATLLIASLIAVALLRPALSETQTT